MYSLNFVVIFFVLFSTFDRIHTKKDPIDYTENDVNKLFEQWEVIY
jgi:hypothetical protein